MDFFKELPDTRTAFQRTKHVEIMRAKKEYLIPVKNDIYITLSTSF